MSTIVNIPISRVRVLNPRARNKAKFGEIVANIAAVGLKKPITVAPREDEPGAFDLVCGQGRLEAYIALEQTEVPALIRTVPRHDRYIMSLVENIARCQLTSMELARELGLLRERGYTHAEIAAKVNISDSYVSMLLRLLDNGEERLIRAVERGEIPIAIAAEIAVSDDATMQRSLAEAYTSKRLRGKALLAARRLVEERQNRGKAMRKGARKEKTNVSADELVRTYQKEALRQQRRVRKARATELQLVFVTNALKRLLADENFVNVLRAEGLDNIPDYIAEAIRRAAA